ncbi:hypothetical protein ALC62_15276 [Cyphomyrmex costatus]|uniref:Uncharacterized protein n=1 Tax=Cyphomyrmex costatus TaxID=456900 RepID=A0A151I7L1_9HYME|nr:hypothetical protein ALC62_15276 [Cyphomyrmex costatus]
MPIIQLINVNTGDTHTLEVSEEDARKVNEDGSWKKQGFSSLFGVSIIIGKYSDKIIDLVVKSIVSSV